MRRSALLWMLLTSAASALPTPRSSITYQAIQLHGRNITLSTALASNSESPTRVVLLLHGWPEASWMWRGLVDPLLAADEPRVLIMPDQRGFNTSSRPKDIHSYQAHMIVADAVQLVQQVAPGLKIDVIGHDWGGPIAWGFAGLHPELTRSLVILNGPHPCLWFDLLRSDPAQQKSSQYMFMDDSSIASAELGPDTLVSFLRNESAKSVFNDWFDEPTAAAMRTSFAQPGATDSGLAWYRANVFDSKMNVAPPYGANLPKNRCALSGAPLPKIQAPTLVLWGMKDVAFHNEANLRLESWTEGRLTVKRYPNATHWIAQELPFEIASEANAFFKEGVTNFKGEARAHLERETSSH